MKYLTKHIEGVENVVPHVKFKIFLFTFACILNVLKHEGVFYNDEVCAEKKKKQNR